MVDVPLLNDQLKTARQQSQQFISRLEQISARLGSRRSTMQLREQIANDMKSLEIGAMARNQYLVQLNQVQEICVATLEEERSRIGQIASQLNQINRQLIQIRAELVGLEETISYRTVRAPISGKVFDVKVSPQTVVVLIRSFETYSS